MTGIIGYASYLPHYRITEAALGTRAGGHGRLVACHDEDTTTMAVEACRRVLSAGRHPDLAAVKVTTPVPPYLVKNNASAVHAALGLDESVRATDAGSATRSALALLIEAAQQDRAQLLAVSDMRGGLPGGPDEREGADAAVAFVTGSGPSVIAEVLGDAAVTMEILERWRLPGAPADRRWEEHFGAEQYVPAGQRAFDAALKQAGLTASEIDYLLVSSTNRRAARTLRRTAGTRPEASTVDSTGGLGQAGAADAGVQLAAVLDLAEPGQHIVVVSLADGADAVVLRTTDALVSGRQRIPFGDQAAACDDPVDQFTVLRWRGLLPVEDLPRPTPKAPMGPPARRATGWKFALRGSVCSCGAVHLPPQRVCASCGAVDDMRVRPVAGRPARVVTGTTDRLAWSPHPPASYAVIDFDGGGRLECELTEVDDTAIAPGLAVEMVFRRGHTRDGVHNYFWKARPVRGEAG
ncbi:OB-fold domain-containing protein [Actinocrispum wychmicini]|uniref:3-hydroxy-3-methylglutaryl CoA synthase n=1 Tax=Actinocrispum wychmicini TaxID=1213861 RepID=A0A4R2JSM5_9PSEU|nr:OB-fold domain-containing protein [Actinocrispum wychmicini]TCO62107.1 3-hydroxy-3-methylglutaryl CoA synthase [Actinocrispum wychmicini]